MEKYLPIGTVVMLKNGFKELMITGYMVRSSERPNEIYDYCACYFPEGVVSSDYNLMFNHEQIEKILFEGFKNEASEKFLKVLIENEIEEDKIEEL